MFTSVYIGIQGPELAKHVIEALPVGRWGILILMQLTFFILGCFLDPGAIILICTPIFLPIVKSLNFDPLWFGILFVINMEMGLLTPPFGMTLFILQGVVPKGIDLTDIYRSILPFIILQALGLAIVIIFPQIAIWIPSLIFKSG